MKASEVFTPQRMPTVTLVLEHLTKLEQCFDEAVDEGGKLIRVIGPSKSGKTVFVRNKVGQGNLVSVTGAGIESVDQLWLRVLDAVGATIPQTETASTGAEASYGGNVKIAGNAIFATGEVQGAIGRTRSEESSQTMQRAVDILQTLIREFDGSGLYIFIDDFHYIPASIQNSASKQIKQAVEKGVFIISAAVPYRSEDIIKSNDDLQGRFADLVFEYWECDQLVEIAKQGFPHLNIEYNSNYSMELASEAAGSPQLMQTLCLHTCYELGVKETGAVVAIPGDRQFFERVCARAANSVDFSSTIEKLCEGPLTRGRQRISYALRDGGNADVYPILVKALKENPPTLHFKYRDLVERAQHQCVRDTPSGSSISDACHHLAKIANSGFPTQKMDWNPDEQVLSVRDPYLLFSIRWA